MEKILKKNEFDKWVQQLQSYKILIPQQKGDIWEYSEINPKQKIELSHCLTVQSPKESIFPQTETLFEFSDENGTYSLIEADAPKDTTLIFGLKPCDAKAVTLMDKVFSGDFKDSYYWKRRNQTLLVGFSCNTPPSKNCFCTSVDGSPFGKEGLDILITDQGEYYYIEAITENGKQLVNIANNLFKKPEDKQRTENKKLKADAEKKIKRHIEDVKKIPGKLKNMFDSPFWQTESMSCIRCGICTFLCPTCHCFDINDETHSTSPLKGKRVRTWDNCQFPDFTMHSSGHNPRPGRPSRLRQRIMHKYQYFVEWHDQYQCTGCGRCVSKCPVGIDIIEVLNKVNQHGI